MWITTSRLFLVDNMYNQMIIYVFNVSTFDVLLMFITMLINSCIFPLFKINLIYNNYDVSYDLIQNKIEHNIRIRLM